MVRGKIQMKRIENTASRQVTFCKRRNGLLKKAYELSLLCDAEVGLMIFSPGGKLYEFGNPSMEKLLEKYRKYSQRNSRNDPNQEQDNEEIANTKAKMRVLESAQRKMVGEDIETCSVQELDELEIQFERRLDHIRARKTELLMAEVEEHKRKTELLMAEVEELKRKVLRMDSIGLESVEDNEVLGMDSIGLESVEDIEVDTQLGI